MPINDVGGNKTLARTIDLDALKQRDVSPYVGVNLVVNPIFEHVTSGSPFKLHTDFSDTFNYAPGWYNFGYLTQGAVESPDTQGPFHAVGGGAGVLLTQNGLYQHGLAQPVLRAKQLAGRRVRVSGCYEVKTLLTDPTTAVGVSLFLVSYVEKQTVDADGAGTAYWTGLSTLTLETTPQFKHLIRMTAKDNDYDAGEDLFTRAFDWWEPGAGSDASIKLGAINAVGVDGEGVGGVAGVSQACLDLYYLRDVETAEADVGTAGYLALVDERTTDVDTKKYFEVFVDIPVGMLTVDEVNGFYGDAWIVLLPVHPDHTGAGDAQVRVWALNIEPVVEDLPGRLLFGAQVSSPSVGIGMGIGGMPARHLLRYPIYTPMLYPLSVRGLGPMYKRSPAVVGDTIENFVSVQGGTVLSGLHGWTVDTVNESFTCVQPCNLPPGSSLVKAGYTVREAVTMGLYAVRISQVLGYDPQKYAIALGVSLYPPGSDYQVLVAFPTVAAGTTWSEEVGFAVRNRIGTTWAQETTTSLPEFDGTPDAQGNIDDIIAQACAHITFSLSTSDGVDSTDYVTLKGGWLLVAVDPRWQHAQWKRHP